MPVPKRRRPLASAKKKNVQDRIVDAAERLIGRHGPDGVSLRQIAAAAGSSNHFVVQYYFGTKADLIRAIFDRREALLETARGKLLADVYRAGRVKDARALLEALFLPLAGARDSAGRHTYAAFLLTVLHHSPATLSQHRPYSAHLEELLEAAIGPIPPRLFGIRMRAAARLILRTLMDMDDAEEAGTLFGLAPDVALHDAINTAAAVFNVPLPSAALDKVGATKPVAVASPELVR